MILPVAGMPTRVAYTATVERWDQHLENYQDQPSVQRSVDKFLERLGEVEEPEDIIDDYELRTFLLQSYNIDESLHQSVGLLKRVLLDDLEAEDAMVYQMEDPRFLKMATDLRLDVGLDVIKSVDGQTAIIQNYHTIGLEMDLGDQNIAIREALYFRRTAGETENAFQILGDNAMRAVVFGAFNIPQEVSYQDVEKQAALVEKHVDIERMSDPEYVEELVDRFLVQRDNVAGPSGYNAGVVSLFQAPQGYGTGAPTYQMGLNLLA